MFARLALVCVLLLSAVGCDNEWHPDVFPADVYITSEMSDTQLAAVQDAADQWARAAGSPVFRLVYAPGARSRCGRVNVALGGVSEGMLGSTHYEWNPCKADIRLRAEATEAEFRWAAVHELGHALGLNHSDDPASVMFERMTNEASLTAETVDAAREIVLP